MIKRTTIIVGKQFHFDAAHFLPGHPTCGKIHGHTWTVDVELQGPLGPEGMVFDFARLKEVMDQVLKNYDHSNLNDFVTRPTCEIIAILIGNFLKAKLVGVELYSVKVQEGFGGYAIYRP